MENFLDFKVLILVDVRFLVFKKEFSFENMFFLVFFRFVVGIEGVLN